MNSPIEKAVDYGLKTAKGVARMFLKKVLVWLVLVFLLFFGLGKAYDHATGAWNCRAEWKESGMDYKYTLGGRCMISPNGYWVPAKNYRVD